MSIANLVLSVWQWVFRNNDEQVAEQREVLRVVEPSFLLAAATQQKLFQHLTFDIQQTECVSFVYFAVSLSNFAFRPTLVYNDGLWHHVGHVQAAGPDHGGACAGEHKEFSYFWKYVFFSLCFDCDSLLAFLLTFSRCLLIFFFLMKCGRYRREQRGNTMCWRWAACWTSIFTALWHTERKRWRSGKKRTKTWCRNTRTGLSAPLINCGGGCFVWWMQGFRWRIWLGNGSNI